MKTIAVTLAGILLVCVAILILAPVLRWESESVPDVKRDIWSIIVATRAYKDEFGAYPPQDSLFSSLTGKNLKDHFYRNSRQETKFEKPIFRYMEYSISGYLF